MSRDHNKTKNQDRRTKGNPGDRHRGLGDGSSRTDYNIYDWSGKQLDDYKQVRREGSDR